MGFDTPSPKQEDNEPKVEFRKLTNEAANRKYRRHSPGAESSDEDDSPRHNHDSRGNAKGYDQERKNDKSSSRSHRGDNDDSYRHSSRSRHSRHDDYSRHGKYADVEDRSHAKSSSRSGRDYRSGARSDYRDHEGDYNSSRDHYRDVDKYSRDRSDRSAYDVRHGSRNDDHDRHARDKETWDEKRDYRSSRDHRSDRTTSYEDARRHHSGSTPKRESDDMRDSGQEEKNRNDVSGRHEARHDGGGKLEDSASVSEDFASKKPRLFSSEESDARRDEKQTLGSKQVEEHKPKDASDESPITGCQSAANLDAAKVAAIKAAELVNKNLAGTGFMTTDQKKKLLWGSKKNNSTEESSRRWNAALFSDREQQEKFNKLMGVKGDTKVDARQMSSQDVEKQRELQQDLEKQYTAGLRRRDGRTVGLGL